MVNVPAALLAAAAFAAPLAAEPDAPAIAGEPEVVFDWSRDRCATWDIPDTPARAWRGHDGRIRLLSGSEESRAAVGPTLESVEHGCAVLHRGREDDDPAAYDDRAWIHSTTTADGRHIVALAHVEYHGHRRRDRCPAGGYTECWRNAIVELVSDDGGVSFRRAGLVAALPYRYTGGEGGRSGYFNPSNILRRGDHLYVFVFAERFGAQRRGPCLMRRPLDGTAADWRAWDGAGFNVRFADPYREDVAEPERHVCMPVGRLQSPISSVVQSTATGRYLAVAAGERTGPDGVARTGIYWMTSVDLLGWTEPALLREAPLLWRRDCAAPAVYGYPSLLDEDSPSPNLDLVDAAFWLYLVEMPLSDGCRVGPERDLIRMRVSWPSP